MFDLTVNVFNLGAAVVTIAAFLLGGIKFVGLLNTNGALISLRVTNVESELKKLGDVLVTFARYDGKMQLMEERIVLQGKRIDTLTESALRKETA